MVDLVEEIGKASSLEIEKLLMAVRKRYGELYPDWEVIVVSIDKLSDRNKQLDRMIAMLQNLKEPS